MLPDYSVNYVRGLYPPDAERALKPTRELSICDGVAIMLI